MPATLAVLIMLPRPRLFMAGAGGFTPRETPLRLPATGLAKASPLSSLMPAITSLAPSSWKSLAEASPIPLLPPVTTATLPFSLPIKVGVRYVERVKEVWRLLGVELHHHPGLHAYPAGVVGGQRGPGGSTLVLAPYLYEEVRGA